MMTSCGPVPCAGWPTATEGLHAPDESLVDSSLSDECDSAFVSSESSGIVSSVSGGLLDGSETADSDDGPKAPELLAELVVDETCVSFTVVSDSDVSFVAVPVVAACIELAPELEVTPPVVA